ncbi:hypothetical protein ALC57_08727 [Trachymyrmex cornetzi]|uniref:Double jelly roll-like domain-containing protein n=1 Tax=Trachymyrmex cornetzi TaxID=471704 RepID=A0A195E2D0_9HYME|nr:hypothetical protein ALC57_08727 [Trachymyrmex cornetzi]
MIDILNITGEPIIDDRIVKIETHMYNPFANTTFGYNDKIRIPIQQQDLYTLSCESFLNIEGRLTVKKKNDQTPTTLVNNCVAFMFDEIRYELNGVEIDRNRNVGITSTIKNKSAIVDVRIEFDCKENVPANTSGTVFTHYIFTSPLPWKFLTRSDRSCAYWLIAYHHGLRWEDGRIPYSEAKRLITEAVFEDDVIVYVKGLEKRTWLWNLLLHDERERVYIETLDAVYEDMEESLTNLDIANTMRCGQHVKNCALQNVLKIYNWWLQKNFFK